MKNVQLRLILILLLTNLMFSSCTKESLDQISTAKEIVTMGNWTIDYYYDGQERTAQFHGYQFDFNGNGTFTATKDVSVFSGTWSTYRNTDYTEELTMHFESSNSDLLPLASNWNVGATSLNSVAMKNADNVQLRFHKL